MKLVIIAAGRGSRLSSISEGLPKILIEVYNKTLLEHLIHNCLLAGISDIVIVTGHNSSMIDDYISKKDFRVNIELIYNCLLYTSPSPRDKRQSRMPSSA